MTILENYSRVKDKIAASASRQGRDLSEITLVAVSKGYPWDYIQPIYAAGAKDFGENRVQEALDKRKQAPNDIRWHMIGHLQSHKVKKIMGAFSLLHSVDSFELAQKISKTSLEMGLTTSILLQANTSGEKSKQGLNPNEWKMVFEKVMDLPGIHVEGWMTMAPYVEDEKIIRDCFVDLRKLRDDLNAQLSNDKKIRHLSMGMSHDFHWAIAEGATILRIGTAIFHQT